MRFKNYLTESMSRYCHIYKAKNRKWYVDLADNEYGEEYDATTYGPFKDLKNAEKELDYHSNPGGYSTDKSGKHPTPKRSPNGSPIREPSANRRPSYSY